MAFVLAYGSDESRSAGDSPYADLDSAKREFRGLMRSHPQAVMTLTDWQTGRLIWRFDPFADTPFQESTMIRITIETGNDAFADSPEMEVARILRDLADRYERNGVDASYRLSDANGNRVGKAESVK